MALSMRWAVVAAAACAVAINVAPSAAAGATIYVDNKLQDSCKGTYSVSARDASGKDGDAYRTICEAASIAKAGDTVLIRAGVYNCTDSLTENDVLWPKNSGEEGKPVVFQAYQGEKPVLGDKNEEYPGENEASIARGAITLKDARHIVIKGLTVRKVAAWGYIRGCSNITIKDCVFENAMRDAKGTMRVLECTYCKFINCTFTHSTGDSIQMEVSDRNLIDNCVFDYAEHCLLAVRGSNYNVIRNCWFRNAYYNNGQSEKLTEVYDVKPDKRGTGPAFIAKPAYDSTKYNVFEHNFFGYHPGECAMQYSGQNGIVRFNVYCNPSSYQDPNIKEAKAGGTDIGMRWGGSWDGWNANRKYWMGEGIEAGFVTGNRFFNNTFFGEDSGIVNVPRDDIMEKCGLPNPPPMEHKNPGPVFSKKYEFNDNEFKNNIMLPDPIRLRRRGTIQEAQVGKPDAILMSGLLKAMRFENNDIFATGEQKDSLIYVHTDAYPPAMTPEQAGQKYPQTFINNIQKDPMVMDAAKADFRLKDDSPMIDAGAFQTVAVGAGKDSRELVVKDAGYFYDGFGIPGEKGDMIQLKGQKDAVRIVSVDFKTNTLKLEKAISWADGDGVALQYAGAAPDIGAFENGLAADQTMGPKTAK